MTPSLRTHVSEERPGRVPCRGAAILLGLCVPTCACSSGRVGAGSNRWRGSIGGEDGVGWELIAAASHPVERRRAAGNKPKRPLTKHRTRKLRYSRAWLQDEAAETGECRRSWVYANIRRGSGSALGSCKRAPPRGLSHKLGRSHETGEIARTLGLWSCRLDRRLCRITGLLACLTGIPKSDQLVRRRAGRGREELTFSLVPDRGQPPACPQKKAPPLLANVRQAGSEMENGTLTRDGSLQR